MKCERCKEEVDTLLGTKCYDCASELYQKITNEERKS